MHAHSCGSCPVPSSNAGVIKQEHACMQTDEHTAVTAAAGIQLSPPATRSGAGARPAPSLRRLPPVLPTPSAALSPRLLPPVACKRGLPGPAGSSKGLYIPGLSDPSSRSVRGRWALVTRARSCYWGLCNAGERCKGAKVPPACSAMWTVGQVMAFVNAASGSDFCSSEAEWLGLCAMGAQHRHAATSSQSTVAQHGAATGEPGGSHCLILAHTIRDRCFLAVESSCTRSNRKTKVLREGGWYGVKRQR